MTTSARELERRIVLSDRYSLLRPVATGGMAEIVLARQKALAGFEKDVVVKLLRDRYRSEQRVVDMFMNEARIGAVLNHPNIVHVYDVGEHERQPFIVMEHIQGEELSQLCRRGLELARFLPLEHAVDLVRQAAEALGYFHAKRDPSTGAPLNIVHRDISPSNFIITNDGVLKIIDFGIARAEWPDLREADDKSVPGKYNYMSPEQVRGERVDARSDIFSLGIVLYELTVGKRLFKGRPEEVIQKITRGRIKPPTFIRRQFPPALEAIVMRALEAHRNDRYATAYELANDLEEFLRTANLKSGPVRIAQYLDELRAAEGGERRPELIIAGEAWLDDDGEEALDFDRGFAPAPPARETPVATALPAAPEKKEPAPEATTARLDKLEKMLERAEKVADKEVEKPKTFEDEQAPTGIRGEPDLDPDLGEDTPTDTSITLPEMEEEPAPIAVRDLTTPMVLTEPTGRVPLTAVTNKMPLVKSAIATPFGTVTVAEPPKSALAVPLTAPPTGRVPLVAETKSGVTPIPSEPPARGLALKADPSSKVPLATPVPPEAPASKPVAVEAREDSMDSTPLPPPHIDETARHPLAEPLREHLANAAGFKLLRADDKPAGDGVGDSMSLTIPAVEPVKRPPLRGKAGRNGKKKAVRRYRPRTSQALEIAPDPMPAPSFGDGILARPKKPVPWPVIGGIAVFLLLVIFLLAR
jgi:tRNA A-37 threonylcarbamoyl transferase component Bud32